MDLRQLRGMELAETRTIRKRDGWWWVPSQTGKRMYRVQIANKFATCECADFGRRGQACKHIVAACVMQIKQEQNADGTLTVTERVTLTAEKKTTYPQNWSAYNQAQTGEQDRFMGLLAELCAGLPTIPAKTGRPRLPLSNAVFNVTFKVYSTFSQRRFMSDLRTAHARGYIGKVPHFNSISNYLEKPELTPLLYGLITKSSLPLRSVETDFAADSSGFTTCRFTRWFDHKYGEVRQKHDWVKCHLMVGVKTNVVTAVEIQDRNAGDAKMLPALVNSTAQNFDVREVSADKGYASKANVEAITSIGAVPFISLPEHHKGLGGGTWEKMYHYFNFRKQEFLQHYHKRSNVESAFSMMKRKFGDSVRSKTDTAMINEALCKILCHNLVVLIHETCELGIEPVFWASPLSVNANPPAIN
jgi:transposase